MEGIFQVMPRIKKIDFPGRGKIAIYLEDGRIIFVPLQYFPSIKSLSSKQRSKWYILGGEGFSFDDCSEVFHIEQVLGSEQTYSHK
jgi:hypothetical protein